MQSWKIGILLFDQVEVLDFAGPYEVFGLAAYDRYQPNEHFLFNVTTISESGSPIVTRNNLKVTPDYSLATAPAYDLIVIPGGPGVRQALSNQTLINWIRERSGGTPWITSVCTGSLLLAQAGLLDGKKATTHFDSIEWMRTHFPAIDVIEDVKYVDEDRIVTSGGVASGIHMSLHMMDRLAGRNIAEDVSRVMEFETDFDAYAC
ncbi:DJ-1/PfpI family protein [Paenibacillus ehimensis]|uniref:DJ-1/PfpI family protein n=1 Tax=Paenibacillus ehimensis TaxID=79264 RepID=UPI00046E8209|nr:DJ-1/PfpI family protein [Paenibacillus ehimensis]